MQPTDATKFTDKAWEAIVKSQEVARRFQNQYLEVEHLAIALLEQEGLTQRILNRAGVEPTRLFQQLESYTKVQPKLPRIDQLYLGKSLDVMLDRAESARENWQDTFISVEHLLLAFSEDERVGRRLMKAYDVDGKKLEATVKTIRGNQKVTDQNPENRYE
ncbi:MAG: Clp protease N-terminal domain-containing protein, partial [Phormidium sp.]